MNVLRRRRKPSRHNTFNRKDKWGYIGHDSVVHTPSIVSGRENIFLGDRVNIDWNNVVFAVKGKFVVKRNCSIAVGCTILTDNHKPELGTRLQDLGNANLVPGEIIIDEDVWVGANCTLLSGVHICRGAIIGAGSCLKGKKVTSYAIVVGNPGKVISFKLKPEQIIENEKSLYSEGERLPLSLLEDSYKNKK